MIKEQNIRDPYDNVQYKFILIPDYQPGKSAFIIKEHHCFTDGLGGAAFMMALSDHWDHKQLPSLKANPWYMDLLIFILYPYLIVKTNYDVNIVPKNHHVMKKNLPITGKKNGAFTEDFNLELIKKFTKKNGCSINDYIGALLGTGLYEYFEKH